MTLVEDLVRIPSPSGQEQAAVQALTTWMQTQGMDAHVDDVGNAVGIRGDGPRTLMLLGHIDTVPGEIPVRIEGDHLYGRGSVDAKGSLCAFAEAVAQASIPEGWRVVVVGAVEEEVDSSKGAYHIRQCFMPDMCVIGEPSGAERITLGYKGRLLIDVEMHQPRAHSARPEPTVGAEGAALWAQVLMWAEEINAGHTRLFEQVMPALEGIRMETEAFAEQLHMTIGFRLPLHVPPEKVIEEVQARAHHDMQLTARGCIRAHKSDKNTPLVRGFLRAIRAEQGTPRFVVKMGTSDMNIVAERWTCPLVAYGPGDSALDHTPNEHLSLLEYQQAIRTVQSLIEGFGPPQR